MPQRKKGTVEFPFYRYLCYYLQSEHKKVYSKLKPLTRKLLDFNNPKINSRAWLRLPQFEAFEMYVFLKEYCDNQKLWEIFENWYYKKNEFEGRLFSGMNAFGQIEMFGLEKEGQEAGQDEYEAVFNRIKQLQQDYPNYIFALTMGLGKTVLMATVIFYEFLLANKFKNDKRFCHNALVFAPDKTVLKSLQEIQTFDKSKVVPPEYISWLDANMKFHYLYDTSTSLNILEGSEYNIVISNTQKVILKKQHTKRTAVETLFGAESSTYTSLTLGSQLAVLADKANIDKEEIFEENELIENQRFIKLARLKQLGVYVDEAHHLFGNNLEKSLMSTKDTKSLRLTINELAANLRLKGSEVVGCYNYTGTPYTNNSLLPEVVYSYGLKDAIDNQYLKRPEVYSFENIKDDAETFCRRVINKFWNQCGEKRVEGMLPKLAFFATTIDEAYNTLAPIVKKILYEMKISDEKVLVNTEQATNDEKWEFDRLDTESSTKQFIVLVNMGREGWNCRSLFGVAMYREPRSTIFVLQASMRCLRSIGEFQHTAYLFLSAENVEILNDELNKNFKMSMDDLKSIKVRKIAKVKIVPPPVSITANKVKKIFGLKEKELKKKVNFGLCDVDLSRYQIIEHKTTLDHLLDNGTEMKDITSMRKGMEYSPYTLVAEIARYLNVSPLKIQGILENSEEGIKEVCCYVNKYNKILYDVVIPKLFGEMYEITEKEEKLLVNLELVHPPQDGYYLVSYKEGLLASRDDAKYEEYVDKSFNLNNYCFDSLPELEMFENLLQQEQVQRVWFTGMLTHGQTDFFIYYIDPESGNVRSYYPDFLVRKEDGKYLMIEVKGDNKIDDAIVLAKQDYARQMALASDMEYVMVKGTEAGSFQVKK